MPIPILPVAALAALAVYLLTSKKSANVIMPEPVQPPAPYQPAVYVQPGPATEPDQPSTPVPPPDQPVAGESGWIVGTGVHARSGPGTNYAILGTFDYGQEVGVLQHNLTGPGAPEWLQVDLLNGTIGYVASQYVSAQVPGIGQLANQGFETPGNTNNQWGS